MQEKKFMKTFRISKIIQLCVLCVIELVFFLILLRNPSLSRQLYRSQPLFALCAAVWVLMLFHFLCLIHDFLKLRSLTKETHALNQIAYLDSLTGIPNRSGLDTLFRVYSSPESIKDIGCCLMTIDNLSSVNDTVGRAAGDTLICDFCSLLEEAGESIGTVGRNSGNEFLFVMDNCTSDSMEQFLNLLTQKTEAYNQTHPLAPISLRHAYILNSEAHADSLSLLLVATYNKLYAAV